MPQILVPPSGYAPDYLAFQTSAFTRLALVAKYLASQQGFEPRLIVLETSVLPLHYWDINIGVSYGERSHTTTFTESGANLYTKDTIDHK